MFLFGCDPVEQDTRLICDCDYVYSDFERSECDSSVYNMNNKSLVFNESKNKFVFGMLDMTRFDQAVTFGEDSIIFSRDTERTKSNNQLNKIKPYLGTILIGSLVGGPVGLVVANLLHLGVTFFIGMNTPK